MGPVSTCGRELLRGWWRPIGCMVSFMIFTVSVRNILDKSSYYPLWILINRRTVQFAITNNFYKSNKLHAENKYSVCTRVVFLRENRPVRETNLSPQPSSNPVQTTVPLHAFRRTEFKKTFLRFSRFEIPTALLFIPHISAICSCVYRDTEEVPDNSIPG
jgi:hypothetical protein